MFVGIHIFQVVEYKSWDHWTKKRKTFSRKIDGLLKSPFMNVFTIYKMLHTSLANFKLKNKINYALWVHNFSLWSIIVQNKNEIFYFRLGRFCKMKNINSIWKQRALTRKMIFSKEFLKLQFKQKSMIWYNVNSFMNDATMVFIIEIMSKNEN